MKPRPWTCVAFGSMALLVSGCHSMYPYQPYGSPGIYSTPPAQTLPPGGTYVPQQGTYPVPIESNPTYVPGQQWEGSQPGNLNTTPGNLNDAPLFQPPKQTTPENGSGLVPDYQDLGPVEPNAPSSRKPTATDNSSLESPFDQQGSVEPLQPAGGVQMVGGTGPGAGSDPFLQPIPIQPETADLVAMTEAGSGNTGLPTPYRHERDSYTWLRGVVNFDAEDKAWQIIYALDPEPSDKFGGSMLLMDDERLDELQESDVVLVEGRVDLNSRDRFGKPMYRVENVQRLEPASHVSSR